MNLKLKAVERFKGSKPALPMMDSSSRTAGCSMKGMAGEIFMDTAAWDDTVGARQTRVPVRADEKAVTAGATKANMVRS